MTINDILGLSPYSLDKDAKRQLLIGHLNRLGQFHAHSCDPYARIIKSNGRDYTSIKNIEDFPYIPVRLFKDLNLVSVPRENVIKTLTSSGTTAAGVSKIYLDKDTSRYQTKALARIMQDFIGPKRLPMLILDTVDAIKDRWFFSARGAGILGMSNFGRDHFYVLDSDMKIQFDPLKEFLSSHKDEDILIFGFTYMVWRHLVIELQKNKIGLPMERGILIHGGGWKKLADEAVDNESFKEALRMTCGISRVHNYYGMVEQIGSIYMECEYGHFHTPVYSDIIIRDPRDWSALELGKEGVIELLSILPHSYPGHVVLTEDLGVILGEDNCACGRLGKYFKVSGRIPKAEIRGCSDTYEEPVKA